MDEDGVARDLSSEVTDFKPATISDLGTALSRVDLVRLPAVATEGARIGPPMTRPGNIFAIGLNYSDHAAESGMAVPDQPILFNKAVGSFSGPNDPILFSPKMTKLDWEVELGIVIGKPALNVPREEAPDNILGYTPVDDISERAWQIEHGGQ